MSFGQNSKNNAILSEYYHSKDSILNAYEIQYHKNTEAKDTIKAIRTLLNIALVHSHNLEYNKAYDYNWKALLLAEKTKNKTSIAKVYESLGWLYSYFKRDQAALKYFNKSIRLNKVVFQKKPTKNIPLRNNYFSLTNFYRVRKDYVFAKKYLDSAYQINKAGINIGRTFYLDVENGFIEAMQGDLQKGLAILQETEAFFKESNPSYFIILEALYGDIYKSKNNFTKSVLHYKNSLALVYKYRKHLDYKIHVHESLAAVFFQQKKLTLAYKHLSIAKEYNDKTFGSRSKNNRQLLNIKDKYRIKKEEQEALVKQQHIKELEHEDKVWFLQTLLLSISLISLIGFGLVFFKHLKNKHKIEKKILREKQMLQIQQKNEVLELKNKELTESALRIIEKDEMISNLKKLISSSKENIDASDFKKMVATIEGNPENNWKEFEARFTSIHKSFYKRIKNKHPKITVADQKICALIKLNFSSKHMAQLLNISVESVHSSRYRIRKKMNLERSDNLEEYIHSF
ncbi:tetratricopeptide repeat protein [Flavicella sediminum]|uniref:tetratricopeptide repeat protein n=1 Tax=Flavicella sediminum TaxID=2585141 RepID=UPI0014098931|nr:tetratricopeptide repeat protein [Flavicella sediminum]